MALFWPNSPWHYINFYSCHVMVRCCFSQVNHPAFDYVPPDLISLYVTNDGNQLPSYVFRQLSEYYHPQDYYIL